MGNPSKKAIPTEGKKPKRVLEIRRTLPEDTPTMFCDALLVQHSGEAFYLTFLETIHPLAATDAEKEAVVDLEQRGRVRIVMPPGQIAQSIKAMTDNFEKWLSKTDSEIKSFPEFIEMVEKAQKEAGITNA